MSLAPSTSTLQWNGFHKTEAAKTDMDILYLLVPLALALAFGAVMAFRWAAQNDQFDDLETPAIRMLLDDEEEPND